jgi:mannosyltransferase
MAPIQHRLKIARISLAAIVVIAAIRLWILPLDSSFWLDECGTVWAISGGPGDIFRRSLLLLQSPLYCLISWMATVPAGLSETALRLPSLIAICAAAFLLYRLGCELFDHETALLSVPIFMSVPAVAFAGVDARPYAAALVAVIVAMKALVTWLETRRLRHAVAYAIAAALTIHFQLLFTYMLAIHAVYAVFRMRSVGRPDWRQIAIAGGIGSLVLSPLLMHFRKLLFEREELSYNGPASILAQLFAYSGMMVAVFLIAGIAVAVAFEPRCLRSKVAVERHALILCLLWMAGPVILLFAASRLTGVNVFVGRYLIAAAPGLALMLAHFIRGIDPAWCRYLAAGVCLIVATVFNFNMSPRSGEDWRSASRAANLAASSAASSDVPLLLYSGLLETASLTKIDQPEHRGYMSLPLAAYSVNAPVIVLPYDASDRSVNHLRSAHAPSLHKAETLLFMLRHWDGALPWLERIKSEFPEFHGRRIWHSGGLSLWRFDRL